jgi:hypothetical protein
MSPLRYYDDDEDVEFEYNVADRDQIRLSYGFGSALYAVRAELTKLYAWSDERQQIGEQFIGVFGKMHQALRRAHSNQEAASLLRKELISQLGSAEFEEVEQCELRDRLMTSLRKADATPVSDPFRVIFRAAACSARSFFGDDWPDNVRCAFEVIGNPPFPNSRFWINAYTLLNMDDAATPPSVRLRINPNQLNAETYSAVYAILVHECFCHVPAHRVKQTNESPFAEGFCDWAARKLFEKWLHELDPLLTHAARYFGQKIWTLMMDKEGGNRFWRPRAFGHEVADDLVSLFIKTGAADQEAVDLVVRLARELIVATEPLILKDSFIRDLACGITPNVKDRLGSWRQREASARSLLYPDPPMIYDANA